MLISFHCLSDENCWKCTDLILNFLDMIGPNMFTFIEPLQYNAFHSIPNLFRVLSHSKNRQPNHFCDIRFILNCQALVVFEKSKINVVFQHFLLALTESRNSPAFSNIVQSMDLPFCLNNYVSALDEREQEQGEHH